MAVKMQPRQFIKIRGANENNLKNLDVDIPRNELVVLTGLSGSEKVLWHLTPFMQRDREGIWNRFLLMPGSFWGRWKNRMWKV